MLMNDLAVLLERRIRCWSLLGLNRSNLVIGNFTVVYLVAKLLIWSEAEGDLVVIETNI